MASANGSAPAEVTSAQIGNLNTQQILDKVISTYTTTHIMKLMNSKQELSIKNVGYMLFVFSITEIKDFIKTMYKEIKTNISKSRDPFMKVINNTFNVAWNKISWIFYRRIRNEPEVIIERPVTSKIIDNDDIIINVQLPVNILNMIFNYQEKKNSEMIKFESYSNIKYLNLTDYEKTVYLKDFILEIPKLGKISFPNNLSLTTKHTLKDTCLIKIDSTAQNEEKIIDNIKDLFELMPNKELASYLRNQYNNYIFWYEENCSLDKNSSFVRNVFLSLQWRSYYGEIFAHSHYNMIETCLLFLFKKCFKDITHFELFNQITFLLIVGAFQHDTGDNEVITTYIHKAFNKLKQGYLWIPNIFEIKLTNGKTDLYPYLDSNECEVNCNNFKKEYIINNFLKVSQKAKGETFSDIINKVNKNTNVKSSMLINPSFIKDKQSKNDEEEKPKDKINNKGLKLTVYPSDKSINYLTEFNNFIEELVKENREEQTNEQTIYLIKLEREKKVKMVENPKYKQYEEKKVLIEKAIEKMDKKVENNINKEVSNSNSRDKKKKGFKYSSFNNYDPSSELWKLTVPEKEIAVEYTVTKIVKKEIRKFKKPLDTLYLRERDHKRLRGMLKAYEHRDEVLTEFGIPHKLGILASGLPGTGKSTCIQAIATYLNLDVYYLDLNGIKKNSELKEMFDYVQKEQTTKGMIVFEDIDAMTSIVHRRTDQSYKSTNLVDMEEDDLSLSYLLNLLDGTLCSDENVYMMTTNHKEKLDPAIFRPGRVDFDIEFKLCDHFQIKSIFKRIIKTDINEEVLNDIEIDKHTPAEIIFHLVQYVYDKDVPQREMMNPFLMKKIERKLIE